MKKFLSSLVEDNAGGVSSVRVLTLFWCLVLFVVWSYVSWKTATIQDIPNGVLGISAMIIGGKVIQRFGEKDTQTYEQSTVTTVRKSEAKDAS